MTVTPHPPIIPKVGKLTFNILVITMLAVGVASPAQKKPTAPQKQEPGIRLGTIGINLSVTVLDKKRRPVTDLTVNNFEIYEDGEPQRILSFSKENELPLNLGVLMDTSNSVRPKVKFEKDASMGFLDTVVRRGRDQALFATFNANVELLQDFTDNLEDLRDAIYSVKAGGPTAMYDAIFRVCEEKMPMTVGRRAIIAISDGEDTASAHTLDEAIEMAQKVEVGVYCIGTNNAGPFGVTQGVGGAPGNKELKRLSEQTGGKAFFPNKLDELDRIFAKIGDELRNQYILFYVSSNQNRDGEFRKIKVKVVDRDDMHIRAMRGYRAPLGQSLL